MKQHELRSTAGADHHIPPLSSQEYFRDGAVFERGASVPTAAIASLLRSDLFSVSKEIEAGFPPTDREYREHQRKALARYLCSPMKESRKDKTPTEMSRYYASTYQPVTEALLDIMLDIRSGGNPRLGKRLKDYLLWYEKSCTADVPHIGRIHPHVFAGVFDGFEGSEQMHGDLNAACVFPTYLAQYVDTLDGIDPVEDLNGLCKGTYTRTATEARAYAPKIVQLVNGRRSREGIGVVEKTLSEIAPSSTSNIRDYGWVSEVTTFNGKGLQKTVVELGAVALAATVELRLQKEGKKEATCTTVPVPGAAFGILGWADEERKSEAIGVFRWRLLSQLDATPSSSITDRQLATCFRYLLNELPIERVNTAIASLNGQISSCPRRLHSRGYSMEIQDVQAQKLGIQHIYCVQKGGSYEMTIDFRGKKLGVMVGTDLQCQFPDEFKDLVARGNVELLVKSHLAHILQIEAPADNDPTGPIIDGMGEKVDHRVAHLRVMPYGNQSLQLTDPTVNEDVQAWLGMSFADLNLVFAQAQIDEHFDPERPESFYDIPIIQAQAPQARDKLVNLLGRLRYKRSSPIGHFMAQRGDSDGTVEEIERDLACELSYVPEYSTKNSPKEPILVQIESMLKPCRKLLPEGDLSSFQAGGSVYKAYPIVLDRRT